MNDPHSSALFRQTLLCSPFPSSWQGLSCVKKHLSEGTSQGEVLNISAGSSSTECPSPCTHSPTAKSDGEASSSSPPQAVVPTFAKHLHPYKKKKSPLVLVRPARWQEKTAGLLFYKAAAVYHSLACTFNSNGKFGRGLKNCKLAFKCLEASQIFSVESDVKKGNDLGLIYYGHVLCCRQKFTNFLLSQLQETLRKIIHPLLSINVSTSLFQCNTPLVLFFLVI